VELKQIKLVLTLARHRHFGRAAIELGLSQSSLSKNLQALEHEVGAPLFDRRAGDVTLTPFGQVIVDRGAGVLSDIDEIRLQFDRLRGLEVGRVRFGVGNAHAADPVGTALGRFVDSHPGVAVEPVVASYAELLRRLHLAEIQFCVVTLPDPEAATGLDVAKLAPRRIEIYCRAEHPLASDDAVDPDRLFDFPLVSLPHLPTSRDLYRKAAGERFRPPIEIADAGMIRAVLRESDAIAVGVQSALGPVGSASNLVSLRLAGDPLDAYGGPCGAIVTRTDRTRPPAADALIEAIMAADADVAQTNPAWLAGREFEALTGGAGR